MQWLTEIDVEGNLIVAVARFRTWLLRGDGERHDDLALGLVNRWRQDLTRDSPVAV
jgi:hypothetical protein